MPKPRYSSRSPLALRFCEEFIVDLNGAAAARRAGYSERRARQAASELLGMREVTDRVAALQLARSARTQVTADDVLQELWAIAKADPRELVEARTGACRYCYGLDHMYQRTPAERAREFAEWSKLASEPATRAKHSLSTVTGEFDERGGIGYDKTRAPHAKCPECNGAGEEYIVLADQRRISARAARLLAGTKTTKEGVEVKMHSQQDALVSVGKHLGMFRDVVEHRDGTIEDLIRDAEGDDDDPAA
jgi:phage terminase small subunit